MKTRKVKDILAFDGNRTLPVREWNDVSKIGPPDPDGNYWSFLDKDGKVVWVSGGLIIMVEREVVEEEV